MCSVLLITPDDEPLVYRAGLPVKLPPGINLDDLVPPDPRPDAKKIFDKTFDH